MDTDKVGDVASEVIRITEIFGMKSEVAAKAMGVSYATYRQKKAGTPGHSFNAKNLSDLKKYIKTEAEKL